MLLSGMLTSLTCLVPPPAASMLVLSSLTRLTYLALDGEAIYQIEDSLSILQTLSSLCKMELISVEDTCTGLAALVALQQLTLSCFGPLCDLSSCTQFTSLAINLSDVEKHCLPNNGAVQLQWLSFDSDVDPDWEFTLENLAAATQLTHLFFDHCYPDNLFWPDASPQLQEISLSGLSHPVPSCLLCCPMLTSLQLDSVIQLALPDWFSGMKQLKGFDLMGLQLEHFPQSILQLTGLQHLNICVLPSQLQLPSDIVDLAQWPHLSYLGFLDSETWLTDSQLNLLDLAIALGSRHTTLDYTRDQT